MSLPVCPECGGKKGRACGFCMGGYGGPPCGHCNGREWIPCSACSGEDAPSGELFGFPIVYSDAVPPAYPEFGDWGGGSGVDITGLVEAASRCIYDFDDIVPKPPYWSDLTEDMERWYRDAGRAVVLEVLRVLEEGTDGR